MKCYRVPALLSLLFIAISNLSAADAPKEFEAGAFKFARPASWEWVVSTSPMRKAELKVPGKDGKASAEVVFFHFGTGQGGGITANVERWYGQFADGRDKINARSEEKTVNGLKITYALCEGTYLSGPPFGQKTQMKGYALVGAIIEDAGGSVFVKMTGPEEITKAAAADFRKMVEGARK